MCQISSLVAAVEGSVAEFSGFANFEEKKRKWTLLIPKIVNEMGSFGQIRKKSLSPFCRPILDIFGFALLRPPSCLRNVWLACGRSSVSYTTIPGRSKNYAAQKELELMGF